MAVFSDLVLLKETNRCITLCVFTKDGKVRGYNDIDAAHSVYFITLRITFDVVYPTCAAGHDVSIIHAIPSPFGMSLPHLTDVAIKSEETYLLTIRHRTLTVCYYHLLLTSPVYLL